MGYDPRWPILCEEEKRRILGAIGHKVLAIEHIGSTAVPGLGAKPIIDIMAGVHQAADAEECLPLLQSLGYNDVTLQPGNPEWYYCLGKGKGHQGEHVPPALGKVYERTLGEASAISGFPSNPSQSSSGVLRAEEGTRRKTWIQP